MDFGANKTPVEIIREGAFGGTHLETFIMVYRKWYRKSRKEFDQLKNIDQKFIVQIIMMQVLINMMLNVQNC